MKLAKMSVVGGQWSVVPRFLIFLLSFLILTRFHIDPDFGWHMAIGRHFLETGQIIRWDQFSWTMSGYPWHYSYFFYEVLVAFLIEQFGYVILAMFFGCLAAVAILFLVERKIKFTTFLVAGLGATVAYPVIGVRPHTISFLMFSALLYFFFQKTFFEKRYALFWFVFFALWVNFHQGAYVGVVVLISFVVLSYIWRKNNAGQGKIKFTKGEFLCLITSVLGILATPFSAKIGQPGAFGDLANLQIVNIAEWQSPIFHFPLNILLAVSGAIYILIFNKNFKKMEPVWFLIAAAIFMFAFLVANFVVFWVAIFIFVVSRNLDFKFGIKFDFWAKVPLVLSAVCVVIALVFYFAVNFLKSWDLGNRMILDKYPIAASSFLVRSNLLKGVFNEYSWGGFLDWQVPTVKVFIDGRMTSWKFDNGRGILGDYLKIQDGRCEVLANYEITTLIVTREFNTECFRGFKLVYEDSIAKILTLDERF